MPWTFYQCKETRCKETSSLVHLTIDCLLGMQVTAQPDHLARSVKVKGGGNGVRVKDGKKGKGQKWKEGVRGREMGEESWVGNRGKD